MAVRNSISQLITAFAWHSPTHADILRRERGQVAVRIFLGIIVTLYIFYAYTPRDSLSVVSPWLPVGGYATISVLHFWYLLHTETSPALRRYANNLADMFVISYPMAVCGEIGMPLFLLYLWVTIGNGFRFGIPALTVSAVLSIAGFGIVAAIAEVWQSNVALTIGVLLALIVIPLQVARHLFQHQEAWVLASKQSAGINHAHQAK